MYQPPNHCGISKGIPMPDSQLLTGSIPTVRHSIEYASAKAMTNAIVHIKQARAKLFLAGFFDKSITTHVIMFRPGMTDNKTVSIQLPVDGFFSLR